MKACPCCGEMLLRHARHTGVYWFCTHCWQEMPALALDLTTAQREFSQQLSLTALHVSRSTLPV